MSIRVLFSIFFLVVTASLGCQSATEPEADAAESSAGTEDDGHAQARHAHAGHGHAHDHGDDDHDCGADHGTQLRHDRAEVRTSEDGARYTHIGAELEDLPEVKVADLVENPHEFEGRKVTVMGNVSTMCGHRRTWFAVVNDGDQSGSQVQVQATPSFLAPAGAVGKRVRVEGKVEVVEMPENRARYLAGSHQMGEPEDIEGPQTRAVIVATGAHFF